MRDSSTGLQFGWFATRYLLVLATGVCCVSWGLTEWVNEAWDGTSTPSGWSIHTYTGGGHNTVGTAQDDTWRFQDGSSNALGYFQMTEDSNYQRTTAIYTAETFNTANSFHMSAEYNIGGGNGADGLCFYWFDKQYVTDNSLDVTTITGGYGEWEGAPHGTDALASGGTASVGHYAGIPGYSFEFDHYQNNADEFQEYTHFIRITDWDHSAGSVAATDFSSDDDFYHSEGWQRFHFDYNAATDTFSYYLETLDGTTQSATTTFTISDLETATGETGWYETFDEAYFGIGAATGGASSYHYVRNTQMLVPEPSSLLLFGGLGGAFRPDSVPSAGIAADRANRESVVDCLTASFGERLSGRKAFAKRIQWSK